MNAQQKVQKLERDNAKQVKQVQSEVEQTRGKLVEQSRQVGSTDYY